MSGVNDFFPLCPSASPPLCYLTDIMVVQTDILIKSKIAAVTKIS